MFTTRLLPLLLLSSLSLHAQQKSRKDTDFSKIISAAELSKQLYIIASPEMQGRNTPSIGLDKAADYLVSEFREMGLQSPPGMDFKQPYPLYKDSVLSSSLTVNGLTFSADTDFQMNTSNYSFKLNAGEVVFAGYGMSDSLRNDYRGLDVRGKVVLVLAGTPRPGGGRGQFINKQAIAAQFGAAAVIQVQENLSLQSRLMGNRHYLEVYRPVNYPPLITVRANVAKEITGKTLEELQAEGKNGATQSSFKTRLSLEFSKVTRSEMTQNVLGMLEGTDLKEEMLILTAHYDHVGTSGDKIYAGADDDGSGTVSILTIARAFATAAKAGNGPRRTILFMLVSGEEKGLWGSAYYTQHPIHPLEKSVVNLNIDMVGRIGDPYRNRADSANYVFIIGDDKLSSALRPISEEANRKNGSMTLDYTYNDPNDPNRFYYRSDHYNFAEKGIPVIFYFNGVHADYHQPTDTPEKINYPLMEKRAKLVYHTAWEIANREASIPRDQFKP